MFSCLGPGGERVQEPRGSGPAPGLDLQFESGQFPQMASCQISQFVIMITTLTPLLLIMSTDNLT